MEDELVKKTLDVAIQQQQGHLIPQNPYVNNCPMCFKPFYDKPQIKRDLLTDEEKELLLKLKKLVTEKKQFLDNLREIIGVQF